jgi:hypothetical protein
MKKLTSVSDLTINLKKRILSSMNNTTKGVDTEFTVAFVQGGQEMSYTVFSAEGVLMLVQGFTRESLVVTRNGIRLTDSEIASL